MYYLVIILPLVPIIFVLCFFRFLRRPVYMHLKRADWKSIPIAAGMMLMTIYFFTYGRTLDWFASGRLRIYVILIPLLFLLFIQRQKDNNECFVSLRIFRTFKPAIGYAFMFIALALFVVEDLKPDIISSNTFFMISIRSSLAPAISASLFSNWLFHRQIEGMSVLAEGMRMDNPLFAGQYGQSFQSALASGHSLEAAAQLADNSFYATLQQQATLLGVKAILGYMLILAIALAILAVFIPFHRTVKVPVVKTGDDMA